jgi:hypothetical protein
MTESVNGNGTEPAYAEAVRNGRDVLDAGVATIKQQLERMRTAQAVQSQFALERIRLTMEQQMARASLEASKAALTESLRPTTMRAWPTAFARSLRLPEDGSGQGDGDMDSPFSSPEVRLTAIAADAVEYLTDLFYRRMSELAKAHPAYFHLDDSRFYH